MPTSLLPFLGLAHAATPPAGMQPKPIEEVVAAAVPPELADCDAAMALAGRNITRWVGCGERTVSVVGSPAATMVDVERMLPGVPASLTQSLGAEIRGEPTSLAHAGHTLPALRLTRLDGEVRRTAGLAVAWPAGVMREVGMCLADDALDWCQTALRALLTPAGAPDAMPGRTLSVLMEPAPAGATAPNRMLQPVTAPSGGPMIGCHRYAGVQDTAVGRMDCTQGRVVTEPIAAGTDLSAARAQLLPYLQVDAPNLRAEGQPRTITVGDRELLAAPVVGDGVQGIVVTDPTQPNPRALGCLDRAPGLTQTPWCSVALDSMWGPSAGDAPPDKIAQ